MGGVMSQKQGGGSRALEVILHGLVLHFPGLVRPLGVKEWEKGIVFS